MIAPEIVQKIIDTVQITDVVQDFVSLKKRGVNYLGLCPFHNEKTPSFNVSPAKGIFKCFGCGKGGNAVHFIMEHENYSYPEALRYLAQKYKIEIVEEKETEENLKQRNDRESMMVVNAFAQRYFSDILFNNEDGKNIGLSYFHERKFKDETIKKFELGFCLNQRDAFTKAAIQKNYQAEYLLKTGLTIERDEAYFDRFWGRVIFPIHALSGKVIAFAGRILKSNDKAAKYLNSPESEVYSKSNVLYGLFFAKRSIIQHDKCYLVEGYTDVISLHQAGIENVVASSGTSLTVGQIRMIKRFTNHLTILYDGDAAGIKASLRGIDMVLEEGLNVKILLFPNGEDPDSFSRSMPPAELKEYIQKNEVDFITFKTKLLLKETENDPINRAEVIGNIVQSLACIPSGLMRSVFVRKCSELLRVTEELILAEIDKQILSKYKSKPIHYENISEPPAEENKPNEIATSAIITDNLCEYVEKELIRVLLNYGTQELKIDTEDGIHYFKVAEFIVNQINEDELEFSNPLYMQILKIFEHHLQEGEIPDEKFFTHHVEPQINRLSHDMLMTRHSISKVWERADNYIAMDEINIDKNIPKAILDFKDRKVRMKMREIELDLQKATEENMNQIMQDFWTLKQISMFISKQIGERVIHP